MSVTATDLNRSNFFYEINILMINCIITNLKGFFRDKHFHLPTILMTVYNWVQRSIKRFSYTQSAKRYLQDVIKLSYQDKQDILQRHLADVQKMSSNLKDIFVKHLEDTFARYIVDVFRTILTSDTSKERLGKNKLIVWIK